jgi:hypothetical protein
MGVFDGLEFNFFGEGALPESRRVGNTKTLRKGAKHAKERERKILCAFVPLHEDKGRRYDPTYHG